MIKKEITIAGKRCFVFADEEPEVLLVEPMDLRDLDFLDKEIETLKAGTARPFALATLIIEDWNKELSKIGTRNWLPGHRTPSSGKSLSAPAHPKPYGL